MIAPVIGAGRPIGFGHVGFQVSDLDRSVAYYRDIIGLELQDRRIRDDPYLSEVTGYPAVVLDMALLREPASGTLLELLRYPADLGTAVDAATANPGTGHVCFVVDAVDAVYERAMAAGHTAVNPPVTPTAGMWNGGRAIYLLDPDGIRVELVQRGPSTTTASSD